MLCTSTLLQCKGVYLSSFELFQRSGWQCLPTVLEFQHHKVMQLPPGFFYLNSGLLNETFCYMAMLRYPRFSKCIQWFVLPWNLSQMFNGGMGTAACNVAIGCCLAPGDQLALFFFLKLDEWSAPLQAHLRSSHKKHPVYSFSRPWNIFWLFLPLGFFSRTKSSKSHALYEQWKSS